MSAQGSGYIGRVSSRTAVHQAWWVACACLLGVVLVLCLASPSTVEAGTLITVNTTVDELNGDGDCSLREAIRAANMDTAVDACPAGAGVDTIALPAGTYTLSIAGAGEDAAATGDLDITQGVTIIGAGMTQTVIDGAWIDRVFDVDPSGEAIAVTLSLLTVQHSISPSGYYIGQGGGIRNRGALTLDHVAVLSNHDVGIHNFEGTLVMTDSQVNSNTGTAGVYSMKRAFPFVAVTLTNTNLQGNSGTGLWSVNAQLTIIGGTISGNLDGGVSGMSPLEMTGTTVSGNSTGGDGGGVNLANTRGSITNCTIRNNNAGGSGGGVYYWGLPGWQLSVVGGTISGNQADNGGGIYVAAATATLDGVTVTDNLSIEHGGGMFDTVGSTLTNVTFVGNTARAGGGLYNTGISTLTNVTFTGNTADDGGGMFNVAGSIDFAYSHAII